MRSVNLYYEPERPLVPKDAPSYYCPVCGAENPEYYYIGEDGIVGCDECIYPRDAAQYNYDHEEGMV